MTHTDRTPSRRLAAGLGIFAAALTILAAGLLLGAEFSADQPLAPALVAGGFGLVALALARQGIRLLIPRMARN